MLRIFLIALVVLLAPTSAMAESSRMPAVAVLYFDNNSGDKSLDVLSKGFADMLITDLSSTGSVTVVEREKLQALLDEAKLQRSKFFDPKTAVKIGKGLGARYVLSGSFLQVKPLLRIDMRMIDVTTSNVVLATQVKGPHNDVFQLEQRLVGEFMNKLNHKFFSAKLPPTKVPNLEALLSYSQGLALIDQGDDAKAATLMKKLVTKAPAFGLARSKHALLIRKMAESSARRDKELYREKGALFAEAKAYIASHSIAKLNKEEAQHYLAYRALLGLEVIAALHPLLLGQQATSRVLPRKGAGRALALVRAYYENQRRLVEETSKLSGRLGQLYARLPKDSYELARALKLEAKTSFPAKMLINFLLHGRAPAVGAQKSFRIMPAPADLDPKLEKAALALAKAQLALSTPPGAVSLDAEQSHILIDLADWHIKRGRVEQGVGELQKILDRFPKLHNWSYIEKRIQEQLGLKYNFAVARRAKFEAALAACDPSDYNVGMATVFSERLQAHGLQAIPFMETELLKRCGKSPKLPKMKRVLYLSSFLKAARFEDCEWFELYIKRWLANGGSSVDAVGYRKNYSSCP